jgi:hypothetical protein
LGLTELGNQAKPLEYKKKKKVVFITNLEQMFKRTAIDLDTQPTTAQQRLTCGAQNYQFVAADSTIREMRSSSESTSHRHVQSSLDWTGWTKALISQVAGSLTNGFNSFGATLKPRFTRRQLILKMDLIASIAEAAATNWHFFSTHVSLWCVVVGCVPRSVAVHLNICSKLVKNTTFFRNTSAVLLHFQPQSDSIRRSVMLQHTVP